MIVLILFSFLGGVVTILSPCILPILPIVLSSSVDQSKMRPYGIVVGFIASFTFFTLFLTSIVQATGIPADYLRLFSIVVIAIFGLTLVLPQAQKFIEIAFSKLQAKFQFNNSNRHGFGGGFLIGLSLGLLWTPCVGPILASVISLALTGQVTGTATIITLAYAAGTAIPMFVIIKGGQTVLQKNRWLLNNSKNIQKIFGVIMILTAIGIYFNVDRQFQAYILQKFPNYGAGLTSFEDNDLIRDLLDDMGESDPKIEMGTPMDMTNSKYPKAPELTGNQEWFGSSPLTINKLTEENKVVLIDFWTYTCINCIRTLPYLRNWHEKYSEDGLVIIGVHTPEFEFEKSANNVAQAIEDFELKYPVVQDNEYKTWRAYSNRYWPAKYLIDKDGYIRYTHFGEGKYDETEEMIQRLLAETGSEITKEINNADYDNYSQTPETYLGYARMRGFSSSERIKLNTFTQYSYPEALRLNSFAYEGTWQINNEYSESIAGSALKINFTSRDVFLVMRSEDPTKVEVYLDDEFVKTVIVEKDSLYELLKLDEPINGILELKFKDSGTQVFAFTFG